MQQTKEYRVGVCCPAMALELHASPYQTFVECKACECRCVHPGQEDGQITCWAHHDCNDGSCTHNDNEDLIEPEEDFDE